MRLHVVLVVPAHGEHEVGATGEVDHRVAGLGVSSEHNRSLVGSQSIGKRVEKGLSVIGEGRLHGPTVTLYDRARTDVPGSHLRWLSRKRSAAVDEDPLTGRMADPGLPIGGEHTRWTDEPLGDLAGERRSIDPQPLLITNRLVPAAEEKTGIVDVVIEMVVGEEEIGDACRPQTCLDHFVGGGGAAVDHDVPVAELGDERRSEPLR
jgi:hypothetical protein